jgi:signal peptidase II
MMESNHKPGAGVLLWRVLVVAALIFLDLWSKAGVFAWLSSPETEMVRDTCGHARHHVLGADTGWFTFMLSENPGAAFGQFSGFPDALVGLRLVAVVVLSVMVLRAKTDQRWIVCALLLVLAGAMGNLYDNLYLATDLGRAEGVLGNLRHLFEDTGDAHAYGKVRDFIDVYFGRWNKHFPTFNVADSCISVGAVILLATSFFKREETPDGVESSSKSPAA